MNILKIDRIHSVAEARLFEAAGATHLNVDLVGAEVLASDRVVKQESFRSIRDAVPRALVGLQLSWEDEQEQESWDAVQMCSPAIVQFFWSTPPPGLSSRLAAAQIPVCYTGIEADHDDDAGWILSRFTGEPGLNADFFQVEFLVPVMIAAFAIPSSESADFPLVHDGFASPTRFSLA